MFELFILILIYGSILPALSLSNTLKFNYFHPTSKNRNIIKCTVNSTIIYALYYISYIFSYLRIVDLFDDAIYISEFISIAGIFFLFSLIFFMGLDPMAKIWKFRSSIDCEIWKNYAPINFQEEVQEMNASAISCYYPNRKESKQEYKNRAISIPFFKNIKQNKSCRVIKFKTKNHQSFFYRNRDKRVILKELSDVFSRAGLIGLLTSTALMPFIEESYMNYGYIFSFIILSIYVACTIIIDRIDDYI